VAWQSKLQFADSRIIGISKQCIKKQTSKQANKQTTKAMNKQPKQTSTGNLVNLQPFLLGSNSVNCPSKVLTLHHPPPAHANKQ
jgi:hypothetical protein